jgi:hypothetical protein
MANRNFEPLRAAGGERVVISGSFAPNGSSALSAASTYGRGFTVARTSAGLFTITLADQYYQLEAATATLQLASGDDKVVQFGTYTAASKTITLRVWDISGAAETDVSANANNRIHFCLVFKNTNHTP